jgi:ankyrin repeat protein
MLWQRSSIEIAQLLISAGANLNIKLSKGMTIYIQQPDGTQTMVKAEDSPAAFVAGSTALMIAAEDGRLDVVRLLLAAGADPLIRNTIGRSAANYALKRYWTGGGHEYEEIGKLLTEAEKVQREKAQIKEQKEKEARKAAKKAQNEKAMRK